MVSVYGTCIESSGSRNLRYDRTCRVSFDVCTSDGIRGRVVVDVVERVHECDSRVGYGNGRLADEYRSSPYVDVESSERFDVKGGGDVGLEEVEYLGGIIHFDGRTSKMGVRVGTVDSLDRERRTGTGIEHPFAFSAVAWVDDYESLGGTRPGRSYRHGKAHVSSRRDVGRGERVVEILYVDVFRGSRHGYFTL